MDDLDVTNDPEIERLGANATAQYAIEYWNKLADAARRDGRLLDPMWQFVEMTANDTEDPPSAHYTTQIVVTTSLKEDLKLYHRFRSNFGSLNVINLQSSKICNPLGGSKWTSLLLASDGLIDDYNFMTLLQEDAYDVFWMTTTHVCDGLVIVPRAQFVFVEVTRIHEKVYGREFRKQLQVFDFKTQSDALRDALDAIKDNPANEETAAAALRALHLLRTQWPNPNRWTLQQSDVLSVVRMGAKSQFPSQSIQQKCFNLLQYWQDMLDLGNIVKQNIMSDRYVAALEHAGWALMMQSTSNDDSFDSDMNGLEKRQQRSLETKTTSDLSDVIVTSSMRNDHVATSRIFRTYGMCVLPNFISTETLDACRAQASYALAALIKDQLMPRGLEIDGDNEFDYAEVRQRPGHRVDNRYLIMDDPSSPIATLSRSLLKMLPAILTNIDDSGSGYKLLYGGVVHSFPRRHARDPIPEAQLWHRDGPSLFEKSAHHDTHCFNVFVPLIDVNAENGTTEFVPGTHNDEVFEQVLSSVLESAEKDPSQQHELAIRAELSAGSVIVFDVRVLHRGLANASMEERPMMYFTYAKEWFLEQHMFQEESIVVADRKDNRNDANRALTTRLYQLVTGTLPPTDSRTDEKCSYGHPHYTTRFDLLLLEGLVSDDLTEQALATQNVAAVMAFVAATDCEKHDMAREFVDSLVHPDSIERKQQVLQQARRLRRMQATRGDTKTQSSTAESAAETEDFASIATDMSDVAALYGLTAQILIEESTISKKLGFTPDADGIFVLLAMLKAHALDCHGAMTDHDGRVTCPLLEETFSAWWHAGPSRFSFQPGSATTHDERSSRKLVVVFSSLGSGIARPEWGGSLRGVAPSPTIDVLNVLDPAFSWYNQDPTCQWNGGEYYEQELAKRFHGYQNVFFLGDSMGAAAALRFSCLASVVLAFTPQVDISSYEAITRLDFPKSVRTAVQTNVVNAVEKTNAQITIHYGEHCVGDAQQIALLPERKNVRLVKHDFDDHILSLHLRDQEKLKSIVEDAVHQFAEEH